MLIKWRLGSESNRRTRLCRPYAKSSIFECLGRFLSTKLGRFLPVFCLFFYCIFPSAHADLLYQNQGCGEVQPSADALRQAFREGREVRIYLTREANGIIEEYMTVITAARFDEPVIAALIPLRPGIDAHANATSAGSIVAGSIDTQGHYRYGSYRFGSTASGDTKSLCFSISWFGR